MKQFLAILILGALSITQTNAQCACCAGASIGSSNGDNNNAAITLPKGKWMVEAYGDYRTFEKAVESHHGEEEGGDHAVSETPLSNLTIGSLGIRYGVSDKIMVAALAPYVFIGTDKGGENGFGDLMLLSTFRMVSKNNFNFGLMAGVEVATGQKKASACDETTVVVGSVSVDPMAGFALGKGWNKWTLKANALAKYTTKGFDDSYYGSLMVQNVTLGYQLKGMNALCTPDSSSSANSGFNWNVFGGYYGEWLGKIEEEGVTDENSGYYCGFASIGTSIGGSSWSIPVSFLMPVVQQLNGTQNHTMYRVRIGFTKTF